MLGNMSTPNWGMTFDAGTDKIGSGWLYKWATARSHVGQAMGFWQTLRGAVLGGRRYVTVGIIYVAADFERTQRVITIGAIEKRDFGAPLIWAYCHSRHALRTFRSDRIVGSFDPDTGETMRNLNLMADGEAVRQLLFFANEPPPDAPFANIAQAQAHYSERMGALGWTLRVERDAWSERLGLHRSRQRGGGVYKNPSVTLCFDPVWVDGDAAVKVGGQTLLPGRPRDHPWAVDVSGGSRTRFDSAAEASPAFEAAAAAVLVKA